ncbi:MAG: hypothetical protein JSR17_02615 [Proteobacteria bacterium]|nr:hypothetical protein [Pseudomonadota bacterium]
MANKIHKHISKALQKRRQTITDKELPPAPLAATEDETLEQNLNEIIDEKREEIRPKIQVELDEDEIANVYKNTFNRLIGTQDAKNEEVQDQNHLAAIEAVIKEYLPDMSAPDLEEKITNICNSLRRKQISIQRICAVIETEHKILIDFLEQAQQLTSSYEKDKIISFFEQKVNNPYYNLVKMIYDEMLSKGIYVSNEDEVVKNIVLYLKNLVLLTHYEYGLLSHMVITNPSLPNPYTSDKTTSIYNEIQNFLINCSTQGLDKISRFIQHAIIFNTELIASGKRSEYLSQVKLTKYIGNSIQVLLDEDEIWNTLSKNEAFEKSKIDKNKLNTLKDNLITFQKCINELGQLKIQLTINKDDLTLIKQIQILYQKIVTLAPNIKLIKDLKNIFGPFQEGKLKKINSSLHSLSRLLLTIKTTIKKLGVDTYGVQTIFLFRIGRGDFFNANDRENLISATFGIHKVVHPIKLLNILIDNFKQYTPEKQEECLLFVKNYLLLDTTNALINVKYEKSELVDKVDMFCQFTCANAQNNPHIENLANDISEVLIQKIVDKSKDFSSSMSLISKGRVPQTHLVRKINTMLEDVNSGFCSKPQIEEYLLEVSFIIESPTLVSTDENNHNDDIIHSIEAFCNAIQEIPEYTNLIEELKLKLSNQLKNYKNIEILPIESNDVPAQYFDIHKLLHEIINGNIKTVENEKSLLSLVEAIESGFIHFFSKIPLDEMREMVWVNDNKRMQQGLMPIALNIRRYHQYFNLVVNYFSILVLNQIEKQDAQVVSRENLLEVKKIHEFIEKSILRAIDKGAIGTACALNTVLNIPAIKRLSLSNIENESLRNKHIDNIVKSQQSISTRIYTQPGLPLLNAMLEQIIHAYRTKAGSEFEKRVMIGKILQSIEEKKHTLQEHLVLYDLFEQMANLMENTNLMFSAELLGDVLIDEEKVHSILTNNSEYLKPIQFKTYQISDFHTLPGLRDQLNYWFNRLQDFHLEGKQPENQIVELIESIIEADEYLEHFAESLRILQLIELIDKINQRTYKNYDHDLNTILNIYYKKISQFFTEDFVEPQEHLETFFSIFNHDPKIKAIIDNHESNLNPFSAQHHLADTIDLILKAQKKYSKSIEMINETRGQQAYSQLLLRVLEGDAQGPIIQLGTHEKTEFATAKSLLPESEYPVPQAEPEHPDYIGINRTMDFNPDDARFRSSLELFASNELKKDFLQSFPWGIDTPNAKKVESAKYSPDMNLLAIDHVISPTLQLGLMNYVLLSLDCIGKLAGFTGELSILNFNRIKEISDSLQEIAQFLTTSVLDNEVLTTKLDHMTYKLILLNSDLTDMLEQNNPPYPVQSNVPMNDFCHINEYLAHKLLGIPYQKSILSPINPYSAVLENVNPKIKEDFLRHSGINVAAIAQLSHQHKSDDTVESADNT